MRSVKSKKKRLQRGGLEPIRMTIGEFNNKFIIGGSSEKNNRYFGKEYIFILHTIDDRYTNMQDTYITEVQNETENIILTIENIHKFRKELQSYNDSHIIKITYNDIITLPGGTESQLILDPIYKKIKEISREFIDKVIERITHQKKKEPTRIYHQEKFGGKHKSKRKSKKRKTHHRKTRSH